jgi:hypothetical protein
MPDVPSSSPNENLRASQSNTYPHPGSLFNPKHKRNRSISYADEMLAVHRLKTDVQILARSVGPGGQAPVAKRDLTKSIVDCQ